MNAASGKAGMASLAADRLNLAALASGLKVAIAPVACRYAFSPSKISWP
jgi:hypothetical protein